LKILGIDTTDKKLCVCLSLNGKAFFRFSEKANHNSALMPEIDAILKDSGVAISNIDCFSAVVGPGSFTGIRVGISTVSAFAFALSKPLISINSFEIMLHGNDYEAALIDAGHGNYYAGIRENGAIKPIFLEVSDVAAFNKRAIFRGETPYSAESFCSVLNEKAKGKEFSDALIPLYLRAPQAERTFGTFKR
jgi:tRNA threonylcarbamoyladenosine biosynthesis protein TsaB